MKNKSKSLVQLFEQNLKHIVPGSHSPFLVAVSGGIDSIVLCDLFNKTKIPFAMAHCNFKLRGKDSERDEKFCKELAGIYAVPFHIISFETEGEIRASKQSLQAVARKLRYTWFEKLRKQNKYSFIVTAHHRDDSIETFFINLMRGTGIAGLHGILPLQGKILRPLLFAGKDELRNYAKENALSYREDKSNTSEKYLRNKIRLRLLPLLKELNPDISMRLQSTIERLRETEAVFLNAVNNKRENFVKEEGKQILIFLSKLKNEQSAKTLLYHFIEPYNFNSAVAEKILSGKLPGAQFFSQSHRLIVDRQKIIILPLKNSSGENEELEIKKNTELIETAEYRLEMKEFNAAEIKISPDPLLAFIDMEKLKFPLKLRKWEKGDSFQPLGMKGRKLLSDYFTDKKFSLPEKEKAMVLVSGGEIVWVVGSRLDDRFKLTEKTKKILYISSELI